MIKNAIVVMFDSLQHNYLGCYGNEWIKTPNFDRFAREGVLFENCYIEGLPTVPCRRAMHTGRYTLPVAGWVPLSMEDTTIADLCWGRPIDTALVLDCPMYRLPKFGYSRGFDKVWFLHGHEADHEYFAHDPLYHLSVNDFYAEHVIKAGEKILGPELTQHQVYETECFLRETQYWKGEQDQRCPRTMKNAVNYLKQVDRNKQFYLWVDSFDPHEPWDVPSVYDPDMKCPYDPDYKGKDEFNPYIAPVAGVYTEEELNHVRMLYAEKVSVCDRALGYLLDNIRALGFEQNTLVMVVSDHGEPMGNGEHGHGIMRKCRPWPYEELVHAPMMLRAPGVKAGQRIPAFVQSVDVAPTVCDWLGIGVHPDMQGKSLLPLVHGEVAKVRDFAIAGYYKFSWSIITEDYTYIHWLKKAGAEDASVSTEMYNIDATGKSGAFPGSLATSAEFERHQKGATTDGEAQWTCTPASSSEVPEMDQLFDRKADKWQLNNIITQKPDVARKLYAQLQDFMAELRNS